MICHILIYCNIWFFYVKRFYLIDSPFIYAKSYSGTWMLLFAELILFQDIPLCIYPDTVNKPSQQHHIHTEIQPEHDQKIDPRIRSLNGSFRFGKKWYTRSEIPVIATNEITVLKRMIISVVSARNGILWYIKILILLPNTESTRAITIAAMNRIV